VVSVAHLLPSRMNLIATIRNHNNIDYIPCLEDRISIQNAEHRLYHFAEIDTCTHVELEGLERGRLFHR
jgi:hypothetical protein